MQLKGLHQGLQKVATGCQCSGSPNPVFVLPRRGRSASADGSDESGEEDGFFQDRSVDTCVPIKWWNLLFVVTIMMHAYSDRHHLALYSALVAHERASGKGTVWEMSSAGTVDDAEHLNPNP